MFALIFWFTMAVSTIFVRISTTSYKGYELLSITPTIEEQLEFVANLTEKYVELDIWQVPTLEETGSLLVPPDILSDIKDQLDEQSIPWNISNSDIDQLIKESPALVDDDHDTPKEGAGPGEILIDHNNYHKLKAINHYLRVFEKHYSDNARVYHLSHMTFERRLVAMLRLSSNVSSPYNSKPSIIIESGIHAREWIAPASTLYVIDHVLKSYSESKEPGLSMLTKYDWYIVPVANPDGYEYTQYRRLWRKNRRQVSRRCIGVDANRNFDIYFGTTGVSSDCNSEVYPGSESFSEAESLNMRDLYMGLKPSLVSYISVHNFGQEVHQACCLVNARSQKQLMVLLIPWHYSLAAGTPTYFEEIYRVGVLMQRSMGRRSGTRYKAGLATRLMYEASGVSIDWALYQKPDIYALSIELRPDYASFTLPETEIVPVGRELLAGLKTLSDEMQHRRR